MEDVGLPHVITTYPTKEEDVVSKLSQLRELYDDYSLKREVVLSSISNFFQFV